MSLEKYKKVFALKRKSRILQKSWNENDKKIRSKNKTKQKKHQRTRTRTNSYLLKFVGQTGIMSKVSHSLRKRSFSLPQLEDVISKLRS